MVGWLVLEHPSPKLGHQQCSAKWRSLKKLRAGNHKKHPLRQQGLHQSNMIAKLAEIHNPHHPLFKLIDNVEIVLDSGL